MAPASIYAQFVVGKHFLDSDYAECWI